LPAYDLPDEEGDAIRPWGSDELNDVELPIHGGIYGRELPEEELRSFPNAWKCDGVARPLLMEIMENHGYEFDSYSSDSEEESPLNIEKIIASVSRESPAEIVSLLLVRGSSVQRKRKLGNDTPVALADRLKEDLLNRWRRHREVLRDERDCKWRQSPTIYSFDSHVDDFISYLKTAAIATVNCEDSLGRQGVLIDRLKWLLQDIDDVAVRHPAHWKTQSNGLLTLLKVTEYLLCFLDYFEGEEVAQMAKVVGYVWRLSWWELHRDWRRLSVQLIGHIFKDLQESTSTGMGCSASALEL
jgi:hypothetical protein